MLKLFAIWVMLVGWAAWVDAKYEMRPSGWSVSCNPPLKFSGNEKKDACFARCQKNPNCLFAVLDNNAKKDTCALVDKNTKCGPKRTKFPEAFTFIANIDPPKYTGVADLDMPLNGLLVDDSMLPGLGGQMYVREDDCGKACGLLKGCNAFSYDPGMGQSPGGCMFKTITKAVTIGKEAKCIRKNSQGLSWMVYFAKAEHAPKKKC